MIKTKAFSFVEIITSLSLILILILPSFKINSKQITTFIKIDKSNDNLDFFNSIYSFLKNEEIFFLTNSHLKFKNYEELKNNNIFENFELLKFPKEEFKLEIIIEPSDIDFYCVQAKSNIIEVTFSYDKQSFKSKIIKFKKE